jgi:hypothetical protein
MAYTDGELNEIESEIMDLKRLMTETQRKLQLQESRIETMNGQLDQMVKMIARVRSGAEAR